MSPDNEVPFGAAAYCEKGADLAQAMATGVKRFRS